MLLILQIITGLLLAYLSLSIAYYLFLALAYLFTSKEDVQADDGRLNRFYLIIPAHDEELLIGSLLENLLEIDYPKNLVTIYVIADNCIDRTVQICSSYPVTTLIRNDQNRRGKGYALDWAISRLNLDQADAVVVLDADTKADSLLLSELNRMLNRQEQVLQCYIEVPNRHESWFTELIFLSRTINNLLYHHAKGKLGLSAYLMGSGMCFRSSVLQNQKWTAYSLSEDWEYYAQLVSEGIRIGFAKNAIVKQQESRSLKQATSQRLRWASGRFYVIKQLGFRLFLKGLKKRNLMITDASFALIFPNMSLLVNLTALTLGFLLILPSSSFKTIALLNCLGIAGGFGSILICGIFLTGNSFNTFKAVLVSPVFLAWKLIIDFVSITGLYKGREWIRTKRHKVDE